MYTTLACHASYNGYTEAACRGRCCGRGSAWRPSCAKASGAAASGRNPQAFWCHWQSRPVQFAGHPGRDSGWYGNLNRQAESDSEPAAAADSELKYFHRGLHRLRGPGPGYRVVILSGASEDRPGALSPGPRRRPEHCRAGSAREPPPARPEPLAGDFQRSPSPIRRRRVKHAGPSPGK